MERKLWWWGACIKTKGLWVWSLIISSAPHYGDEKDSQQWRQLRKTPSTVPILGSHILSLACPALLPPPFPLCFTSHPLTHLFCTEYLVLSFKIFMCLCVRLYVMCVGASEGRKKCWGPLSWGYREFWGTQPGSSGRAASTLNWWAASLAPLDTMMGAGQGERGEEWKWRNELIRTRLSGLLSKT